MPSIKITRSVQKHRISVHGVRIDVSCISVTSYGDEADHVAEAETEGFVGCAGGAVLKREVEGGKHRCCFELDAVVGGREGFERSAYRG